MSLRKMSNGAPGLTLTDYEKAFAEIKAGKGFLYPDMVQRYMDLDPTNAKYLYDNTIAISRQYFIDYVTRLPNRSRPAHVLYCSSKGETQYYPFSRALDAYDLTVKQLFGKVYDPNINPHLTLGTCISCREFYRKFPINVQLFDSTFESDLYMFDVNSTATANALLQFASIHRTHLLDFRYVLGICRKCHTAPCQICRQKMPMPRVTLEILEGYLLENICPDCGMSAIVKLPHPKLDPKQLRGYRNKLRDFGKGG